MKRAILTILACALSTWASAQTNVVFICPSGSWSDGSCWYVVGTDPPVFAVPTSGQDVLVGVIDGTFVIDEDAIVQNATFEGAQPGAGIFSQAGNDLEVMGLETVELNCIYTQSGGINTVGESLAVQGNYELQDGELLVNMENVNVLSTPVWGNSPGLFHQTGGTHATEFLAVGDLPAATIPALLLGGTYNLAGGLLDSWYESVGALGDSGTFIQSGGTNKISNGEHQSGQLILGVEDATSNGTYTLGGSGILSADIEVVGEVGSGTFHQVGGQNEASQLIIGQSGGAVAGGKYTLSQGTLTAITLVVGAAGSGGFAQSGGTVQVNSGLSIGQLSGGKGLYSLSGNGQLTVSGDETIAASDFGPAGIGEFDQSGASTHKVTQTVTVGNASSLYSGRYFLYGGTLVANSIVNNGSFWFSGGHFHANVTNNGIFYAVNPTYNPLRPTTLTLYGDLTNYGSIYCHDPTTKLSTTLIVTGTYVNHGVDNGCVKVY